MFNTYTNSKSYLCNLNLLRGCEEEEKVVNLKAFFCFGNQYHV